MLGLGARDRGDDAVGPVVAEAVGRRVDVDVEAGPRDPAWILDAWRGRDGVVVVDATRSGARPGTVLRLDPRARALVDSVSASTHGLGLASAIELGDVLGECPERLLVVGVEAASFAVGAALTHDVRAAVPEAVDCVAAVIDGWQRSDREEDRHA